MNHHYTDIVSRIAEPPAWWDENATPRWGDFEPRACSNIYARNVCLLLIECQNCGREFKVCMSDSDHGFRWLPVPGASEENVGPTPCEFTVDRKLADLIRADEIHYGDPPNTDCCHAGATMNSVPKRVLEFWELVSKSWEFQRVPSLERAIDCGWKDDE